MALTDYPQPSVTCDLAVFSRAQETGRLQVLLIERADDPFKGRLALPGGFLDPTESLEQAACRELREETGVTVDAHALRQVGTWSTPGRDPRGWVVSCCFFVLLDTQPAPAAADDAASASWYDADVLAEGEHAFAFDHAEMFAAAYATALAEL